MSEELDVGVSELGDGSHAAANTSAGERVGGAGGYLLRGQSGQAAGSDGGVGLNHLGGGERPAGAALALVLHRRHDALLPPARRACSAPLVRQGVPRLGGDVGSRSSDDAGAVPHGGLGVRSPRMVRGRRPWACAPAEHGRVGAMRDHVPRRALVLASGAH